MTLTPASDPCRAQYCNPPPEGRWKREDYCPVRWDGVHEAKPRMRASDGPLGVDAVGPLWVNGGRETAGAQTLSAWPGIGPFLALAQPSNAGLTCLLNYFPPSNSCDAHGVQDRLWNPALMDGGKLMAAAVKMVRRTYLETSGSAGGGGGAAADESSMMDEMASVKEYLESWALAGEHIEEAISHGALVRHAHDPTRPETN